MLLVSFIMYICVVLVWLAGVSSKFTAVTVQLEQKKIRFVARDSGSQLVALVAAAEPRKSIHICLEYFDLCSKTRKVIKTNPIFWREGLFLILENGSFLQTCQAILALVRGITWVRNVRFGKSNPSKFSGQFHCWETQNTSWPHQLPCRDPDVM